MKIQKLSLSRFQDASQVQDMSEPETQPVAVAVSPSPTQEVKVSTFWHNRFVEVGLILSMALFYIVGNPFVRIPFLPFLQGLHPFTGLPFLFLFAFLSWYRLPFAIALLPLSLPYYYIPRMLYPAAVQDPALPPQGMRFSLIEILLWTCVLVALLRLLTGFRSWSLRLWWIEWRERIGPFFWPLALFGVAACLSLLGAFEPENARRTLRQDVVGPLIYLALVLVCLRTRQDVTRLLMALFGCALIVTGIGLVQWFFYKSTILPDHSGLQRLTTVYGSGNSVGLLFDYTLPIGLALVFSRSPWPARIALLICSIPCFFVLFQSSSRGSLAVAIPAALFVLLALSMRKRKLLLIFGVVVAVVFLISVSVFREQIYDYVVNGHTDVRGHNTTSKRFYLWQSALDMVRDRPWFGYGMDNWLCFYSKNTVCPGPEQLQPYLIAHDPVTGKATGMTDEPLLSHPHNVFLHVWVSIGVFGFLAFTATLALFFWLWVRLLFYLHKRRPPHFEQWRWMVVGVGAAMLAAMLQGQVDSAFLEQDLSFCFWTLVAVLLLLRRFIEMPWQMLWPVRKYAAL